MNFPKTSLRPGMARAECIGQLEQSGRAPGMNASAQAARVNFENDVLGSRRSRETVYGRKQLRASRDAVARYAIEGARFDFVLRINN